MITPRLSKDRGHADHGWLDSYHTFSFADYYDRAFMGYRAIRVINEDYIEEGKGFGTHGHNDMEIITYVVEGELQHKDSMGNTSVILPGEVQYMSAGTGVRHSEFNPSPTQKCHLFQIWVLPDKTGHTPRYGQKSFANMLEEKPQVLVISKDGREGSIGIHQDAEIWASRLKPTKSFNMRLAPGRHAWVQMVKGSVNVNGTKLEAGDAAAISDEESLAFLSLDKGAEFLVFDLK